MKQSLEASFYIAFVICKIMRHERNQKRRANSYGARFSAASRESLVGLSATPQSTNPVSSPSNFHNEAWKSDTIVQWMKNLQQLSDSPKPAIAHNPWDNLPDLSEEFDHTEEKDVHSLPHLALFAWLCWEYQSRFTHHTLPKSVLSWLFEHLSPQNLDATRRVVHTDSAAGTILDVLAQVPPTALKPQESECYLGYVLSILQSQESTNSEEAHIQLAALGALANLFFKRADQIPLTLRAASLDYCTALLGKHVPNLPTTSEPVPSDYNSIDLLDHIVRLCRAALRAITRLSYTENDSEFIDLRCKRAPVLLGLLLTCLRPISFRKLHRSFAEHAVDCTCLFLASPKSMEPNAFEQLNKMRHQFAEAGVFLCLRLHLAIALFDPRWLSRKASEHATLAIEKASRFESNELLCGLTEGAEEAMEDYLDFRCTECDLLPTLSAVFQKPLVSHVRVTVNLILPFLVEEQSPPGWLYSFLRFLFAPLCHPFPCLT